MTKQKITASIRTRFGQNRGVINLTEFTQYMGVDRSTARKYYLNGLEYITTGRTKWYDIGEVAERLMEMRISHGS